MDESRPTRNLALELARVTEAAALASGRYMGRGDQIAADRAAVDAMRLMLNTIRMNGVVVIGEGEKDEAPMLFNGEHLGTGNPPEVDIAVDPIDGTRPFASGLSNAISTVAMAPRGTMFNPGPCVYMHKLAVGAVACDAIDIQAPLEENLRQVARAKGEKMDDLTVAILDRPRHAGLIADVRRLGARIRLINDGDVAGALMTAMPDTGIDVLMGIGGTPEGVIAACALRAMGGNIQGRLHFRNEEERRKAQQMGMEIDQVLRVEDLVSSDDVFFAATGLTNGDLLKGIDYYAGGAFTDTLVVRGKTGTIRRIQASHRLDKLATVSRIPY
ncbi:MAG TPA: class II fructose-bisphosphatase [Levilinea sp.]|nr:class II fructose-bisphosphatase [Levilinea sp.]